MMTNVAHLWHLRVYTNVDNQLRLGVQLSETLHYFEHVVPTWVTVSDDAFAPIMVPCLTMPSILSHEWCQD